MESLSVKSLVFVHRLLLTIYSVLNRLYLQQTFSKRSGVLVDGQGSALPAAQKNYAALEASAAINAAALLRSTAWVTARPMTRRLAPAAMASAGLAARA
jgi:hypothetical protein